MHLSIDYSALHLFTPSSDAVMIVWHTHSTLIQLKSSKIMYASRRVNYIKVSTSVYVPELYACLYAN